MDSGKVDHNFFEGHSVKLWCSHWDGDICHAVTVGRALPKLTVQIFFERWIQRVLGEGDIFVLTDFTLSLDGTPTITGASNDDVLLPTVLPRPCDHGVAELFSGLAGWNRALAEFGLEASVFVEKDWDTALCHSRSSLLPVLSPCQMIDKIKANEMPKKVIIHGDIEDSKVWAIISWLKVSHFFASPPCQSWSSSGLRLGLDDHNGQLMQTCIRKACKQQAKSLTLENVVGIQAHEDYKDIQLLVRQCGYKIANQSIDEVFPVLPVRRKRWLATILPAHVQVDFALVEFLNNAKFPQSIPGCGAKSSLASSRAYNDQVLDWEMEQLIPTADALLVGSDFALLPRALAPRSPPSSPDEVLKCRIISEHDVIPSLMASYGSQHSLPSHLLRKHGLHSWFLQDGSVLRYLSAFEAAFALGFGSDIILPSCCKVAHRMVGNAISFAHACIQVWRTHLLLGQDSPFQTRICTISDIVELVFQRTGRFGDNVVIQDGALPALLSQGLRRGRGAWMMVTTHQKMMW